MLLNLINFSGPVSKFKRLTFIGQVLPLLVARKTAHERPPFLPLPRARGVWIIWLDSRHGGALNFDHAQAAYRRWVEHPVSPPARGRSHSAPTPSLMSRGATPNMGIGFVLDQAENYGCSLSRRTVKRCHSPQDLGRVTGRRGRGSGKTRGATLADDPLQHQFTDTGPNQLWLTHITDHPAA